MTDYLIDGEILGDIADAIREKTNSTDPIAPENMASEIASITVGNKVTDLTDSTWYIPSGWIASAGYGDFAVNFDVTINGTTTRTNCNRLAIGFEETVVTPPTPLDDGTMPTASLEDEVILTTKANSIVVKGTIKSAIVTNSDEMLITFTGGADIANTDLINWLYTYGELQTQEPEIDLSAYQTKTDENLNTESKEIVSAINELNTFLKGDLVGTWVFKDSVSKPEYEGEEHLTYLQFTNEGFEFTRFTFYQEDDFWCLSYSDDKYGMDIDEVLVNGEWSNGISKTITITEETTDTTFISWLKANATKISDIELDTENKSIVGAINELNAKIGTSTPSVSLIGTWTVIDEPEIPKSDLPLEFTCNGTEYMAIGTTSMGSSSWGINALSYQVKEAGYYDVAYTNNPSGSYGITHGWSDEAYKTITVTEEPTDPNAIAWLGANTDAPKIDTPSKPCFEMPQIRFTSATGSTDNDTTPNLFVDAENPLKLTVEIVGGGALQVGDQLQVCYRKRFNGSMANGFKRKYKLQRFAEYVVTEEDLDKQYLTVSVACEYGSVDKMLHHAYRGLFHDGKAGEIAPLYLRIRRPKGGMQNNDSGQTVDAEFSNIVTIWKHSIRGIQTIRIQ